MAMTLFPEWYEDARQAEEMDPFPPMSEATANRLLAIAAGRIERGEFMNQTFRTWTAEAMRAKLEKRLPRGVRNRKG